MTKQLPSPELLRQVLRYEPDTGKLFWKERDVSLFRDTAGRTAEHACANWNNQNAGAEAFTATDGGGYRSGGIFGRTYRAHRVIWAMETGAWPEDVIDHEDNDTGNNRWINLREVTQAENCQNSRSRAGASSKFLGVSWYPRLAKWQSKIKADGRLKHLGLFADEADAARAYDAAAREHFGEFANPNFPEEAA